MANATHNEKNLYQSQFVTPPPSLKEQAPQLTQPTQHSTSASRRFVRAFLIVTMLYASFSGFRHLASAGGGTVLKGMRMGCGGHRKLVTEAKFKLPAYHALPSGDKLPSVALGTWQAPKGQVGDAVKTALKAGYRHIDGAWIYGNEAEVGVAIKESGIKREDLWLTSKLWNTFHNPEDIEAVLDESLSRLQTTYLDLYLIHWPIAFKSPGNSIDTDLTENPLPTWKKLEEMVSKGKIRNIGVSNFNIRRLTNLTTSPSLKIRPAVNQVELNFFNPQPELLAWSKKNGIVLEAYSPLGSNTQVKEALNQPEVKEIASKLNITPAQVLISWAVQRGTVVLPKSVTPSRVEENLHVVALPKDLFEKLEKAATAHPPHRVLDPSKSWGIDIFEDEK